MSWPCILGGLGSSEDGGGELGLGLLFPDSPRSAVGPGQSPHSTGDGGGELES